MRVAVVGSSAILPLGAHSASVLNDKTAMSQIEFLTPQEYTLYPSYAAEMSKPAQRSIAATFPLSRQGGI